MKRRALLTFFAVFIIPAAAAAAQNSAQQTPRAGAGRLDGVATMLVSGETVAARARIQEALELYRKENDRPQEAVCYLLLGLVDASVRNEAEARVHLTESMTRFDALGEHLGAWFGALTLAEMEHQQMHYDLAAAAYEKALANLEKAAAPGGRFSLDVLKSLPGAFDVGLGDLPADLPGDFAKPIILMFLEIPARTGYASVLVELGELNKAEGQLARASNADSMFGGLFRRVIVTSEGDLRRRQWRFDEAREKYRQALAAGSLLPVWGPANAHVEDEIYGKLADVEMLTGRVDDAIAWHDKAIAAVRAAKNLRREPWIVRERADLLVRSSRLDAAEVTLREALAIAEQAGDIHCRGMILADLGVLDLTRGRYGSAAVHYRNSIELLRAAKKPADEAYAWVMLSNLYTLAGDVEKAKVAIREAFRLAETSDLPYMRVLVEMAEMAQKRAREEISQTEYDEVIARSMALPEVQGSMIPADFFDRIIFDGLSLAGSAPIVANLPMVSATVYMLEGKRLLERGQVSEAREMWRKGLDSHPSRDLRAGLLLLLATYADTVAEAAEYLTQAAEAAEVTIAGMPSDELVASYLGGHAFFYFAALIEALTGQGCDAEAFEFTERARARAFLQLVGGTRLQPQRGAEAPLIAEAEALRTQIMEWERHSLIAPAPAARRITSDLSEARSRYAELLQRLKASTSEYASLAAVKPQSADSIRSVLPPDATLISYFNTDRRLHAWIVDRSGIQHVALSADSKALLRAVCWGRRFGPGGAARGVAVNESECTDAATAEEVHDLLIAPLRSRIANRRLIIVPHNSLHYIPFAALRNGRSDRYLVQDYSITYVPSASSLRFLRAKETPVDGEALVLGDPVSTDEENLPYAREEAIHVAEALGATAALGTDATENLLYTLDGKIDLIHIAAHARYDSEHPLFSRVSLAPGGGRDGNLEVIDVLSELDLTGVNLVVLSACESAAGKQSGGDDVTGLTRALLYSGTPGVISTLWRIPDDATAALMDELYCRLLAGDTAADALRMAQLAMLQGEYADPGQWAAFILTGNPLGRWGGEAVQAGGGARSPQAGQ
ncbi:MAG TPA: CHAT domain-containing tetratricopeptide repeat protein [Thermoanaerobaculia bacterium]|nr:CHAT domain-containing tetratricopeptide repeat protein [Thermoanaerobaculia bacterium]